MDSLQTDSHASHFFWDDFVVLAKKLPGFTGRELCASSVPCSGDVTWDSMAFMAAAFNSSPQIQNLLLVFCNPWIFIYTIQHVHKNHCPYSPGCSPKLPPEMCCQHCNEADLGCCFLLVSVLPGSHQVGQGFCKAKRVLSEFAGVWLDANVCPAGGIRIISADKGRRRRLPLSMPTPFDPAAVAPLQV
ncbi:hypothetical protein P4O66_012224 [Electrophorus voltai]|uniref:Uncharacterized protein n=1 Tax=Electrophorus voltai TaxID=2609070 RepID=A0AAD8Z3H9_9TELE|nr:hypothetical protein P4O66_012224 [Electrophorus voltai]